MGEWNSQHNAIVWLDLPVKNLDRAIAFYAAVLGRAVFKEQTPAFEFAVLDHEGGNGACLIVKPDEAGAATGPLVYLNVNGRLSEAVQQVPALGGKVLEKPQAIGPHGFRAVVLDSEGNRIALHSAVTDGEA